MSRLTKFLNERKGDYGKGISFVDIDETLFSTFAKIHVVDKETGEVKRKLNNQEFNSYKLQPDEEFDFKEFEDAKLFKQTSKPITPTIDRIKRMITKLKQNSRGSKIIFLTARSDFDNKREFLNAFREHGIDVDFKPDVYIERAGNLKTGTIPERKERIILSYLRNENFRRVRMFDDHEGNLKQFLNIADNLPNEIVNSVREEYDVPENEVAMEFFALHVGDNGKLSLYGKEEVY